MKTSYYSEEVVREMTSVDVIEFVPGYCAVRKSVAYVKESSVLVSDMAVPTPTDLTVTYFMTPENVKKFLHNKPHETISNVCALSDTGMRMLREYGYNAVMFENWNDNVIGVSPEDRAGMVRYEGIFEGIESGEIPVENVLIWDGRYNILRNIDGSPKITAWHVDYIGGITNDEYDMPKALEILTARDDVAPPVGKREIPEKIEISSIPYYNAEPNHTHCIEFIWRPKSDEEFARVFEFGRRGDIKGSLFRMDYFGLDAGGAKYAEPLPRGSIDDDDF